MLEMIKRCYFLARKKSLASLNFVLIYGYDRLRCAPFSRHISQYLSMLQKKSGLQITSFYCLASLNFMLIYGFMTTSCWRGGCLAYFVININIKKDTSSFQHLRMLQPIGWHSFQSHIKILKYLWPHLLWENV